MHRIFTRVFLSFWAAIVLIAAASVAVTTLNFKANDRDPSSITKQASDVFERGGLPALRTWLTQRNQRVRDQRMFIFDLNGREITGQKPPKFRPWRDRGAPRERLRPDSQQNTPSNSPQGAQPNTQRDAGSAGVSDTTTKSPSNTEHPNPPDPPPFGPPPGMPDHPEFGPHNGPGFGPMSGMHDFPPPPGRSIRTSDGAVYRVVFDPPPRRGPFSPPFSWPARGVLLALAIAISGLISYLLARSIASPLQDLQGAARSLSTGNLAARANVNVARRKDELGTLAREFDSMAERLSDLISARQQLLRDISHELRSPLARLQMALQLLRQDASSADSQLDRIERESERLEMLIDQVLEYARLERDPATLTLEEVDLIELVRQIIHDATFESQSAPDRLQFTHPDLVLLHADPNLMHAVIDNVVRNALLHGGETSKIDIAVTETPSEITLSVRDHGAGVPESELQRIFEPFYRVVDSISHKARNEGSGIGLAIAARAMALHGGRITAQNAPDGGLLVTMSLPRAATTRVANQIHGTRSA